MDNAILLGIDGTGPLADREYEHEMRNSFVNYIVRNSPARIRRYMRGPWSDGLDMSMITGLGYEFVHLEKHVHPDPPVLLAGYSRGAAAVIGIAARLAKDGVKVPGMMLFDPVDRSPTSDAEEIPNNVLVVHQARRIQNTFSRVSFNNCANVWHAPTKCDIYHVWATHGGMGGVPWKPQIGETDANFVSEGNSELVLMHATYEFASISWRPEPGERRSEFAFLADRYVEGNHTRVTYQQDAEGARRVWHWAAPKLRDMGFLAR